MKRKVYLSLDIDFWNNSTLDEVEYQLDKIFTLAQSRGIKINAVMNHQQLTKFVDKSGANVLLNVDQHSDLADMKVTQWACGTWVSFVRWRFHGKYVWLHRHNTDYGECNPGDPIFENVTKSYPRKTDWKSIEHRRIYRLPSVKKLLTDVVEIGFVLSPDYSDNWLERVFRAMVSKYGMRYVRGVRNEQDATSERRPVKFIRKKYDT